MAISGDVFGTAMTLAAERTYYRKRGRKRLITYGDLVSTWDTELSLPTLHPSLSALPECGTKDTHVCHPV